MHFCGNPLHDLPYYFAVCLGAFLYHPAKVCVRCLARKLMQRVKEHLHF